MTSLSGVKQAEIIEAFKSTSRYLDDLLNIDNPYFEGMVNRIVTRWRLVPAFGDQGEAKTVSLVLSGFCQIRGENKSGLQLKDGFRMT